MKFLLAKAAVGARRLRDARCLGPRSLLWAGSGPQFRALAELFVVCQAFPNIQLGGIPPDCRPLGCSGAVSWPGQTGVWGVEQCVASAWTFLFVFAGTKLLSGLLPPLPSVRPRQANASTVCDDVIVGVQPTPEQVSSRCR